MNNWEDFWISEGFATFIERQVIATVFNESFAMTEALLGNYSIGEAMEIWGMNNTYASLHPVLSGDDPDNSYSQIPFEKGYQLLAALESIVGYVGAQDFIEYYIYNLQGTSFDQYQVRSTFEQFVFTIPDNSTLNETGKMYNDILDAIDWEEWIYEVGYAPQGYLNFTTNQSDAAQQLAWDYISTNGNLSNTTNYTDYFGWSVNN